ncbi:hypothetical protein P170DRAFT_507213 [Aspergillus steynii IBT 23096]|uniref:Uncharacterized protein n=1 Tax=Aspergillus steynii IBT 23096 TaxID=1392250 RepID=A0A2I2GHQ5_9EURO|nr:uncharacterized protein P170DRAFT_507213 [Aspergillus steynii IBT 23096]PLB52415.1 hypothetical protein P170DRAFT_507213 [Aspergillus steynii IBT 23096]
MRSIARQSAVLAVLAVVCKVEVKGQDRVKSEWSEVKRPDQIVEREASASSEPTEVGITRCQNAGRESLEAGKSVHPPIINWRLTSQFTPCRTDDIIDAWLGDDSKDTIPESVSGWKQGGMPRHQPVKTG